MNQRADFSERENDVIALLLTGKSNKQIAHALGISTRTVEFHLGNIYNKLQVNSRSEAILNLSSKHLWESTGISTGNNLREDTVEFRGQEGHNKGKPPLSKWRLSMKTQVYLGTGLLAVLVIAIILTLGRNKEEPILNQAKVTSDQAIAAIRSTQPPENATPLPSSTPTAREQILAKIFNLAADYEQKVSSEMQNGDVTISTDPKTGQQVIHFEGKSMETISKLHDEFIRQFRALNDEYKLLYIAEMQPTPFPTKQTIEENDIYYQQLVDGYQMFFDQVLRDGPTVRVFDLSEGTYFNMIIGDAYAKSEIMADAMEALRIAPISGNVNQDTNISQIRQFVNNPDLPLTYVGVGNLANAPWIDAAIYTDNNGTKYWMAIAEGRLAQIEPPYAPEVPAMEVKTIDEIRPIAEQFAYTNSPRYTELKSELTYEEGNKGDIYFFTWSYRNRDWTGTDWMMMAPFLQIGFSADGKITTYINTLDLFH
jgi:DNA-binding CsgD family transcriptional regulator